MFQMYQPLTIPVFFSVKKSFPASEACNNEKQEKNQEKKSSQSCKKDSESFEKQTRW